MSEIFGLPLFGNIVGSTEDPISNLNNWTKQDIPNDLIIDYESSSKTNRFSYDMPPNHYERMYYRFEVKPNTDYMFQISVGPDTDLDTGAVNKPIPTDLHGYAIRGASTGKYCRYSGTYYTEIYRSDTDKSRYMLAASAKSDAELRVFDESYNSEKTISLNKQFTYDGFTVYYWHSLKTATNPHNDGYIDSYTDYESYPVCNNGARIDPPTDQQLANICWLMVYGQNGIDRYMPVEGAYDAVSNPLGNLSIIVATDIINESKTFDEMEPHKHLTIDGGTIVNYDDRIDPARRADFGVPFSSNDSQYVYLYIDYTGAPDSETASYVIRNIKCGRALRPGVFYLKNPLYLNGEHDYYYEVGDAVSNIALAYPGAWAWSFFYPDRKEHHIYALSGNEFKIVSVNTSYNHGYQYSLELKSEPIDINGRTYYKVHKRWSDISSPDVISYTLPLSDDEIYSELAEYVRNEDHIISYDILSESTINIALGVTIGAVSAADVPSLFKLTDEEYRSLLRDKSDIDYSIYDELYS